MVHEARFRRSVSHKFLLLVPNPDEFIGLDLIPTSRSGRARFLAVINWSVEVEVTGTCVVDIGAKQFL